MSSQVSKRRCAPAMLSIVLPTAVAFAAVLGSTTVFAEQPSTFQKSCNNIKYGTDKEGTPIVMASCLKVDGKTRVNTAAALRGFQNKEGSLTPAPGVSSFQKTCKDMKVEVKGDQVLLIATCKKTSGEWAGTSTFVYDIENIDGNMRHKVPGNDKVVL